MRVFFGSDGASSALPGLPSGLPWVVVKKGGRGYMGSVVWVGWHNIGGVGLRMRIRVRGWGGWVKVDRGGSRKVLWEVGIWGLDWVWSKWRVRFGLGIWLDRSGGWRVRVGGVIVHEGGYLV